MRIGTSEKTAYLLMIVGMALIPGGDAAGKIMGAELAVDPFFIAWSRFSLGAFLLLPLVDFSTFKFGMFLDWRILLRGFLIVGGIVSIQTALVSTSMATVFGAFFVGPIFAYFGAAFFLKEPVSAPRTVLLGSGFVGVLLVIKPGFDMEPGVGFALLAGLFYGGFLVANRWLAHAAPPRDMLFSQLVIGAVVLLPVGAIQVPELSWQISGLVLASAGFSLLGNLFLILALRRADASRLAPFIYFQLIFVVLFGYLLFGDLPGTMTIIGLLVVLMSGFSSYYFSTKKNDI